MNPTKEDLQKQLRDLEEQERHAEQEARKQENYKKFKERPADWMIGKAHADFTFINERYPSDREKPLLPHTVRITGNCGTTFTGTAPTTSATSTYFRNVWNTNYSHYEEEFQAKLNALVQEEVGKICRQLPVVLEMMGLQSNHYYINENHFPKEKVAEVERDVEQAQAAILDTYKDKDFLALIRKRGGWVTKGGEDVHVPERDDVNLSHSTMILFRYIFKHRPKLQPRFKECRFYESWKERIEA